MFSARHCRDQAAECVRLMNSARTTNEARLLENISVSLTTLAGQIERYNDLMRKKANSGSTTRRNQSRAALRVNEDLHELQWGGGRDLESSSRPKIRLRIHAP
jgi:hypothetical protein